MATDDDSVDWSKTTFEGSRLEQLRRARAMTVRQRLEALDQLRRLSDRMRAAPLRHAPHPGQPMAQEPQPAYGSETPLNEITLAGCNPTPLAGYLKALGVLRLLAAKDHALRGCWRHDRFVVQTTLDASSVRDFFLAEYEPTPIVGPWNAGSGFYYQERKSSERDPETGKKIKLGVRDQATAATKVVDAICQSPDARLKNYQTALSFARRRVNEAGLEAAPDSGPPKDQFIKSLRAELPDTQLAWLDATVVATAEGSSFPPLLGTGGNDGNLDFTSNFMQRVLDVLGDGGDASREQSSAWLNTSLFGSAAPGLMKNNIGQFSPGQAGGLNSAIGYAADAVINPWDYVLMIEGSLAFSAATSRRGADDPYGVMNFPFTVRAVGAGAGSLGEGDAANARGELWLPLWDQPATLPEIRSLLAEGRVALGRKPARDALDFIRAVHHLGGYRGVRSFQRFGLLQRFGKNYLATPLARVHVAEETRPNLADDLDRQGWLERFRRAARGENASIRLRTLRRRLEDRLFDLSGHELRPAEVQTLLMLLGEINHVVAMIVGLREDVCPLPRLAERWVACADDGTPAFRIARALAGLQGVSDLPLRAQLFPMHRARNEWLTPKSGERYRVYSGQQGSLLATLRTLLERRLWLAEQLDMADKPLSSPAGATLDDLAAFLRDERMDARIAALLPGLSLCTIPEDIERTAGDGMVPAAFGVMKLALTPDRVLRGLGFLGAEQHMPIPAGMVAQLAAGNHGNRAVKTALRRLRASGLASSLERTPPELAGIAPERAAAALLIPLRRGATATLARTLLKQPESELGETDVHDFDD